MRVDGTKIWLQVKEIGFDVKKIWLGVDRTAVEGESITVVRFGKSKAW